MIKNDRWIKRMALEKGMIEPFEERQVRTGVISYGLSSYGYDIRIADAFKIFTNVFNTVVDPKEFDPRSFVDMKGPFTIDLSAVTFMDSSGISALTRVIDVCPGTSIVIRSSRNTFAMLELAGMVKGDWPNVVVAPPEEPADPAS